MLAKSFNSKIVIGVGLGVAVGSAVALILRHRSKYEKNNAMFCDTVINVKIPINYIDLVIGHEGSNIKNIETKTNCRIIFKDELETDLYKVASIYGQSEDVQLAEIMIIQTMTNRSGIQKFELKVSSALIDKVIGENRQNIRRLQQRSGSKIIIEKENCFDSLNGYINVQLKGTPKQIEIANSLINEIINSHASDKPNYSKNHKCTSIIHPRQSMCEELIPVTEDQTIEVFMSSIVSPSSFYVQKVGPSAIALDKLTQEMTSFFEDSYNRDSMAFLKGYNLAIGDIVAAQLSLEEGWYRVRVEEIFKSEEAHILDNEVTRDASDTVEVLVRFVDYGVCERKGRRDLCRIPQDSAFLDLKFQAIECSLVDIAPRCTRNAGNADGVSDFGDRCDEWPLESIEMFSRLTHCAKWKPLLLKSVSNSPGPKCQVLLYDILDSQHEDVNISCELVRAGKAEFLKSFSLNDVSYQGQTIARKNH